ncbi:hypothetical protein DFH29DRAFT_878513 [Suillus ampliporus]|nr:hypothetical protein DFH29DRAFT_878513 [Suillus ampliporus]
MVLTQSQDFISKTDFPGSLGPSKDISALESSAPSLKCKIDFGDICQVIVVYSNATSDVFLKRKADAQLGPFAIKCVTLYELCNSKVFIWSLPAEILITTITLLAVRDLCSVTQVSSLLREITALLFFLDKNFPTSPQDLFHICVDLPNFDILSTWRRMDTFRLPRMVLSWLDSDLQSSQLSAFLHFLELLENIHASGVEELMCMGFCNGTVSPSVTGLTQIQLLPFTIQTIHLSRCLEKLRLSSVKLSSAQWDKLLCHFAIPMLVELRVNGETISNLSIIPPPGGPWRTNRIITPLTLSLSILDGPLSHLLLVLWSHCKPQNLTCLYISLQAHNPSPNYITSVLQCVSYCDSIRHLVLSLPNGHSSAAMMCLSGTHSMVHIKHLVIDYSDGSVPSAAGDPLALSVAWIQALPQVKCVTLRGYSATAAGDLLDIMHSFAVGDVELAVDLHVSPESHLSTGSYQVSATQ